MRSAPSSLGFPGRARSSYFARVIRIRSSIVTLFTIQLYFLDKARIFLEVCRLDDISAFNSQECREVSHRRQPPRADATTR